MQARTLKASQKCLCYTAKVENTTGFDVVKAWDILAGGLEWG